ncbi:N-acetyltransferase family protein [Propioniciclava flava]
MSEDAATLRPATPHDVASIVDIYNQSVAVNTASWDTAAQTVAERLAWFEARTTAGQAVIVAERHGRVIGWGSWGPFRAKDGYRMTMEDTLYVDDSARGLGVGSQLLAALIDSARDAGVHALIAAVSHENDASIALHKKHGFTQVGRLPQVGAKFGRWLDLVLLQRTLDDRPLP